MQTAIALSTGNIIVVYEDYNIEPCVGRISNHLDARLTTSFVNTALLTV